MNEIITINEKTIVIKEYNGQRVVTFKDIDHAHDRPDGTAKRNFNKNKRHFIEGVDYFVIKKNDVGTKFVLTYGFNDRAPSGTFLTESGYLMIVKSFQDDLSWDVQRQLVNGYFKLKEIKQQIDYSPIIAEINVIKNDLQSIKYFMNRQQPFKHSSKWRKKVTPKIKLLAEYFGETQLTMLSNLYVELEDMYDIDLNEYKADYCFEMNLDNCSQFDVIENNKDLRNMFELLINSLLDKYGLKSDSENIMKRKTIFDMEVC